MITTALERGIRTYSAAATEAVGWGLARELPEGTVLGLLGDLGVGKTTFVRGFAAALGHVDISSPSFNYYFWYRGERPLIHLDAYRLSSAEDYRSLMLEELITPQTRMIVEWPERVSGLLPPQVRYLRLAIAEAGVHTLAWATAP
jgi:tRNA threonylcarbamoyladenosine biosynthesis protein TsaE